MFLRSRTSAQGHHEGAAGVGLKGTFGSSTEAVNPNRKKRMLRRPIVIFISKRCYNILVYSILVYTMLFYTIYTTIQKSTLFVTIITRRIATRCY